jgi:hypothetical protein
LSNRLAEAAMIEMANRFADLLLHGVAFPRGALQMYATR